MVAVDLHILPGDMDITKALDHLSTQGGSGIVEAGDGPARVIGVADLLQALRLRADATVAQARSLVVDRAGGKGAPSEVTVTLLDTLKARVEGLSPEQAVALRTSVTLCRCTEDDTHVWQPDELALPGRCNLDGAPVVCT